MSATAICLLVILGASVLGLAVLLFLPRKGKGGDGVPPPNELSIDSGAGIVTVRKIGPVTSVTIRQGVSDHWEGPEGIALPLPGTEAARRHEPALWAEYMNPATSAIRKYEIIDEVYALGFTLPYIRGLNEQYQREMREALASGDPDSRAVHERTPVNLTPARQGGSAPGGYRKVHIDGELRHAPLPDMGEDAPEAPGNQ